MQAKHVFNAGSSGGGKTTFNRELYAKHDGVAVWVNHTDPREGGFSGKICKSMGDMVSEVRKCDNEAQVRNLQIDYRPQTSGIEAMREPVDFAAHIGRHFKGRICTLLVADEGQHLLPDDEEKSSVNQGNPTAWAMHEGRDLNIKTLIATQDPVEVYYPPIKNCKYLVWCGETKTFHRGFLNYWGLRDLDLPMSDHTYAVIKPTDPPEIVHVGETKSRYS